MLNQASIIFRCAGFSLKTKGEKDFFFLSIVVELFLLGGAKQKLNALGCNYSELLYSANVDLSYTPLNGEIPMLRQLSSIIS